VPTPPPVPSPRSIGARLFNLMTRVHVEAYRRTGGRVGNRWQGAPILLLEHVGRKSGNRRTTPLLYLEDGDDLVIVGSRGGSDAPPAWWLNLEANPDVAVQVGSEHRSVKARTAGPEERRRLWPQVVEMYSDYENYQKRTDREIPLVILSRSDGARGGGAGAGGS
jgi:F420H(2)-dependent quinone reductase